MSLPFNKKPLKNLAVVGASGAVGKTMIHLLEERRFPLSSIKFLASERSARQPINFAGETHFVEPLSAHSFKGVDLVLSSTPAAISRQYTPLAVQAGAVVVDNASAFRMDPEVPLIVPEVNRSAITRHRGIIANPNCVTIPLVIALKPIRDAVGIRRVVVSTYQSVSGAGHQGIREFRDQTLAHLAGHEVPAPSRFFHPIAFNCIPQIDDFLSTGYTKEEMKVVNESRKILEDDTLAVSPTCVRVPLPHAHSESICVETERPINVEEARELWSHMPGLTIVDDPAKQSYPMPAMAAGLDSVFIGRIRQDLHHPKTLLFWCVSDNLRKGAATNAIQIAEELLKLSM